MRLQTKDDIIDRLDQQINQAKLMRLEHREVGLSRFYTNGMDSLSRVYLASYITEKQNAKKLEMYVKI
jgi:hypothetical protein